MNIIYWLPLYKLFTPCLFSALDQYKSISLCIFNTRQRPAAYWTPSSIKHQSPSFLYLQKDLASGFKLWHPQLFLNTYLRPFLPSFFPQRSLTALSGNPKRKRPTSLSPGNHSIFQRSPLSISTWGRRAGHRRSSNPLRPSRVLKTRCVVSTPHCPWRNKGEVSWGLYSVSVCSFINSRWGIVQAHNKVTQTYPPSSS